MYTVETLQAIATASKAVYDGTKGLSSSSELVYEGQLISIGSLRGKTYNRAEYAQRCIEYMEANGLTEVASIGPFHPALPADKSKVRIKAGAVVHSFNPRLKNGKMLSRNQTVTVSHTYKGYIRDYKEPHGAVVNWAGTGGYWNWTSIDNVEVI